MKEFNIILDVKKEAISNKINGLNLNDTATVKIKFVQNSLPYDINNKDIRIDYKLPDGVLLFQNQNTGVTKVDGNTIDIKVINQSLQQVGDVALDISIFEKDTSKKITTSKLILKVGTIIYNEEQLSTDFDALQTVLNDSKKLEHKFGTAKDLDNKLQQDFKTGTTLDNTLREDIKNANTSKSNLATTISTANNTNSNLKNTINAGDKLKQELTPQNYVKNVDYQEFKKESTTQYEDLKNYNKNYYKNFGVNLIKNSGYIKDLKYWVQQTGGGAEQKDFCIKTGYNDLMSGASLTCTKMVEHGWCILANASLIDNKFKFIIGETYTISGYIWSNKDSTVGLQICDGNAGNFVFGKEMKCTSGYNYFCYTFKPKITGNENQIRFTLQGNTTIYIPFIKLEIGNIATPWSKNHLENLEEIDSLDSKFTLKNAGDITDFNKVLSENEYRVGNSVGVANAPYTGQIYGKLLVYVDTGNTHNNINNWIWQIFMNTRGETYKRRKTNNSEWSQWIQLPERQEIIAINKRLDAIEQTLIEKGFNIAKSRLNI